MAMFATLEELIAVELDPDRELCPFCGSGYIVPGTTGARYGVCPNCYGRAKTAGIRAQMEQNRVENAYDVARKQKSRAVKAGKVDIAPFERCDPDFDAIRP